MGGPSSPSFVPSVIKTDVPLESDDRAHKDLLLQKYGERIEKLPQEDKLTKFCMDAGFLNVVETGQYVMTKDTAEFSQFTDAVTCREYTLPRGEETSEPKGWSEGTLTPGQNFSWLKQIGHRLKQQQAGNPRSAVRRICVKIECEWFCKPIKGKSKTTKTRFCQLIHKNYSCWGENLD